MNEMINLTLISNEEIIKIALIEEEPIHLSFYNIALPDPRVTLALQGSLQAEANSLAILAEVNNVQDNINEIIEEAVIEVSSSSVVTALIFG